MTRAWWCGTLGAFRAATPETIVVALALRQAEAHPINREEQLRAWRAQIPLLRTALADAPANWSVLLEYPLLRLGKRIDAVVLTDRAVLVIEAKTGAQGFTSEGRRQADDFALDLKDFHAACRGHPIVPILLAEAGAPAPAAGWLALPYVPPVRDATATTFPGVLAELAARFAAMPVPDVLAWDGAPYHPVPGIVEAARMLYARHNVPELIAARADVANLTRTAASVQDAIAGARTDGMHRVLVITGIPGAGKTLCGLNAVFGQTGAAFLTGNLPLVHVMRAALTADARARGRSTRQARREAATAIQPVNGFLKDNKDRADPPHEHVIVFDEAQRAWDAAFGRRKFAYDDSEAGLVLDIMSRHRDWAVVVALVGIGQEINTGEAGLAEWGRALSARARWSAAAPPDVIGDADPRRSLFPVAVPALRLDQRLHLAVPVRSIRTPAVAPWVEAVLAGEHHTAARIAADAGGVPFRLTRSLATLRAEMRGLARGLRRAGLVCSAGARRLVADGLWPAFPHMDEQAVAHWFLARWPDVRASDALEMPATQFACQGLELDHVGLAWGGDLIRERGAWVCRRFAGSAWQTVRDPQRRAYILNTYRVLLTRARYETVLYVPPGDPDDETRSPTMFDAIATWLGDCGAAPLPPTVTPPPQAEARLL